MKEINLTYFLLMGLASWRICSLFMKESGPWGMFIKIRELFGIKHYEDGSVLSYRDNFFCKLFACCWCFSVWVGGAFALLYIFLPSVAIIIALPLALSTISIIVEERL